MQYRNLKVYAGAKTKCDRCQRAFMRGQVIHVDARHDLAFCESGPESGNLCLMEYTLFTFSEAHPGQPILADAQVFEAHEAKPVRPEPRRQFRLIGKQS